MHMLPLGSRHLSQKGTLTFSQPKGGKTKLSTDHLYMEVCGPKEAVDFSHKITVLGQLCEQ